MPKKPADTATATATEKPVFVHPQADVSRAEYAGLSSYINAGRKLAASIDCGKYGKRADATLTPRMRGCIAAMRKAYGSDQFTIRGFDNAQLAIFLNSGILVNLRNAVTINGCVCDGDKPATAKLAARYAPDATKPAKPAKPATVDTAIFRNRAATVDTVKAPE